MKDEKAPGTRNSWKFLIVLVLFIVVAIGFIYYGITASGQISTKNNQISDLSKQSQTLQTQLSSANSQVTSLQGQLSSSNSQVTSLQGQLSSANSQVSSLQSQLSTANSQASSLQSRLNTVLDTPVMFYYPFVFQLRHLQWNVPITLRPYLLYKDKPRITDSTKYGAMTTDSGANSLIDTLVNQIKSTALTYDLKESDIFNLVATFVQSLIHGNGDIATAYDDYTRYPVETLFEQGGDSEDNSILVAAILNRMGYNLVFFSFDEPVKHIALGIDFPVTTGTGWEYKGKRYIYLETTGENWALGQCPLIYTKVQPTIIPLAQ